MSKEDWMDCARQLNSFLEIARNYCPRDMWYPIDETLDLFKRIKDAELSREKETNGRN